MNSPRDKDPKSSSSLRQGTAGRTDEVRCVRLTRKYADVIDGVDLSKAHVGDRLDLSPHDAEVLIAEGWAERDTQRRSSGDVRAVAEDKTRRRKLKSKKKPT